MKYILEYKKHSSNYTEIDYRVYNKSKEDMIDFDKKFAKTITETIYHYYNNHILFDSKYNEIHFMSNYPNDYSSMVIKFTKKELDKNDWSNSYKHYFRINIFQTEDEWFYTSFYEDNFVKTTSVYYYKCDQIEGILNLICDLVENPFKQESPLEFNERLIIEGYHDKSEIDNSEIQNIILHKLRLPDKFTIDDVIDVWKEQQFSFDARIKTKCPSEERIKDSLEDIVGTILDKKIIDRKLSKGHRLTIQYEVKK